MNIIQKMVSGLYSSKLLKTGVLQSIFGQSSLLKIMAEYNCRFDFTYEYVTLCAVNQETHNRIVTKYLKLEYYPKGETNGKKS
jgi:hypothetical protein